MTTGDRDDLAGRVAAHVGRSGDPETIAQARGHVDVVTAFVETYTRSRGFTDGVPARPLQAVIVAAASRLTTNPEQVAMYAAADYTERPAVFSGWNLAETAVLHEYRTRWA